MARAVTILVIVLLAGIASADQFNDNYFQQPGDPPLDLTHESGEKGGYIPEPPPSNEDDSEEDEKTNDVPVVPPQQTVIETEEDALQVLVEEGAVSVEDAGVAAIGIEEDDGGGYSIVVDGDKVRASAGSNVDIGSVLKFWRGIKGKFSTSKGKNVANKGRLTTGEYYALIASELAVDDENLDEAALSASRFEISYRSRGKLFALIPLSFPVRVEVTGAAEISADRVHIKLPWYRWFVRKYFSASSLASEVDAVVLKELSALPPEAEDVQAVLFTAVTDFLRQKVQTISDSILLGA
ncbi:hypothetical protein HY969_03095 [Candidatus Kaiserbacteria bacterium]|nr:hypothetical protein [Candidatus Kaiserbacteria bacterium]